MEILNRYKDADTLRDEIGTCPNIEIKIDVVDKVPFFLRPYHVNEDDKQMLDREIKRLLRCYIIFSWYRVESYVLDKTFKL